MRAYPDGRPLSFTVFPPRTLPALMAVETRRRAGVDQLRRLGYLPATGRDNSLRDILATKSPQVGWLDILTYLSIKLAARLLRRAGPAGIRSRAWARDETSRISE